MYNNDTIEVVSSSDYVLLSNRNDGNTIMNNINSDGGNDADLKIETVVNHTKWYCIRNKSKKKIRKLSLKVWFIQLIAWLLITVITKVLCACVILLLFNQLSVVGSFIFEPLESNPQLELVIVMIITPTVLNIIMFVTIDHFIMAKSDTKMKESIVF